MADDAVQPGATTPVLMPDGRVVAMPTNPTAEERIQIQGIQDYFSQHSVPVGGIPDPSGAEPRVGASSSYQKNPDTHGLSFDANGQPIPIGMSSAVDGALSSQSGNDNTQIDNDTALSRKLSATPENAPPTLANAKTLALSNPASPESADALAASAAKIFTPAEPLPTADIDTPEAHAQSMLRTAMTAASQQGGPFAMAGIPAAPAEVANQFTMKAIDSATNGLAQNHIQNFDAMNVEPVTTTQKVFAGLGRFAGFVLSPTTIASVGAPGAIGILSRVVGDSATVDMAKIVASQSIGLGLATTAQSMGQAIDNPDQARDILTDAATSGAGMGAIFGAMSRVMPEANISHFLGRAVGNNVALNLMNGTSPTDDRPLSDRIFDAAVNTFFSLHGAGGMSVKPDLAQMRADAQAQIAAAPDVDSAIAAAQNAVDAHSAALNTDRSVKDILAEFQKNKPLGIPGEENGTPSATNVDTAALLAGVQGAGDNPDRVAEAGVLKPEPAGGDVREAIGGAGSAGGAGNPVDAAAGGTPGEPADNVDPLYNRIVDVARTANRIGLSFIRRNAGGISWDAAARILDKLIANGVVDAHQDINTGSHAVLPLDGAPVGAPIEDAGIQKSSQVVYTGHAGTGGLQGHSIGEEYPFMVKGKADGYAAADLRSGEESPVRQTYAEAQQDLLDMKSKPPANTMLNVGLETDDGQGITESQIRGELDKLGVKVLSGQVYGAQHAGDEPKFAARLSRPLTPDEAHQLSIDLKQQSIAQHTSGAGELYGPKAADWRPFNPDYFTTPDGGTLSAKKYTPLAGLPASVDVDGKKVAFGPFSKAKEAADEYARSADIKETAPADYVKADPARAKRIAQAYEDMKNDPQDPQVKAAYAALARETLEQWKAVKRTGLKVEFFPNGKDTYGNPRNAIRDVVENNHLFIFPTESGYGDEGAKAREDNPMLARVPGESFGGKPVLVNDLFRAVHDYFGHVKEGIGFRADGEENAWRQHMAMFSPEAQRALTTETRGQNSWVNYGPHAEHNKTASGEDTKYAPQKIGLLPKWVSEDGYKERSGLAPEIVGTHFSKEQRSALSGNFYGSGLRGREAARLIFSEDPRITKRLSFYVDEGNGVHPEAGVGGARHDVKLNNLYDAGKDPLRLRSGGVQTDEQANAFESAVLDHGFSGYYVKGAFGKQGAAVLLGDATKDVRPEGGIQKSVGEQSLSPISTEDALSSLTHGMRKSAEQMIERANQGKRGGLVLGTEEENRQRAATMLAQKNGTTAETERARLDAGLQNSKAMDEARAIAGKLMRHLTPVERTKLRRDTAQKMVDIFDQLPSSREVAAVAYAGKVKRGWYRNSAHALTHVFGADAPRFTALLAAMSPQNSLEMNLRNALKTWKTWIAEGRPTDRNTILDIMGRSVEGNKLNDSVLESWKNNSVRALTSEDPSSIVLSGPKVDSFMRNLRNNVEEVTNDAWMSSYFLLDKTIFKGKLNAAGDEPGKSPGYLAVNAKIREAAKTLTKLTGDEWTPSEVQETVWSWAKTVYELQSKDLKATDALDAGMITDELLSSTPDFRNQLHEARNEKTLNASGYGEQLRTLRDRADITGATSQAERIGGETAPFDSSTQRKLERKSAARLEKLREQREGAGLQYESSPATADPLDDNVFFSRDGTQKTNGFYHPEIGTTFVNTDNVSKEDIPGVILHEVSHAANNDKLNAEVMHRINVAEAIQRGYLGPQKSESANAPTFYSQLAKVVSAAPDKLFTNPRMFSEWLGANAGKLGVKKAEIEATGLDDWLKLQGKVTKSDVQNFLDHNGVQVNDVTLGQGNRVEYVSAKDSSSGEAGWMVFNRQGRFMDGPFDNKDDADIRAESLEEDTDTTKFASYQLPGGENYKELLLTLPKQAELPQTISAREAIFAEYKQRMDALYEKAFGYAGRSGTIEDRDAARAEFSKLQDERNAKADAAYPLKADTADFKSSHFDQPNILAHIRFNERTDAEGKPVLFLEELQSDWGQKGKKAGFISEAIKNPDTSKWVVTKYESGRNKVLRAEVHDENGELIQKGLDAEKSDAEIIKEAVQGRIEGNLSSSHGMVSSAPFVTDTKAWTALALKRMIRYAAENGFDKVAWTTGEQQAARYDLSKQVNSIVVTPRTDAVTGEKTRSVALDLKGSSVVRFGVDAKGIIDNTQLAQGMSDVKGKHLSDVIGKEMAERVMATDRATFEGSDLKVGGEGMKGYYDQIVPQVANDVLKKLGGGKVENVTINQDHDATLNTEKEWNESAARSILKRGGEIYVSDASGMETRIKSEHVLDIELEENGTPRGYILGDTQGSSTQQGFTITPELRAKVMTEGMPLFSKSGAAHGDIYARVRARMEASGVSGDAREATSYLVEEAMSMGRTAGHSRLDTPFWDWATKTLPTSVVETLKQWVAAVRAAMFRAGVVLKEKDLTIDDFVAVARANMRDLASGKLEAAGGSAPMSGTQLSVAPKEKTGPKFVKRGDVLDEKAPGVLAKVGSMADSIKNGFRELKDAYLKEPEFNESKRIIGKYTGALQMIDFDLSKIAKQINLRIPADRQVAITNYMQAGGDEAILRQRAADSFPEHAQGYKDALTLTPEEKATAKFIQDQQEEFWKKSHDAGILEGYVENYVRGQWQKENAAGQKMIAMVSSGMLNDKPREAMHKVFQNYFEGEKAGFVPVDKRIGYQFVAAQRSVRGAIAARQALTEMMHAVEKDGRPMVVVGGGGSAINDDSVAVTEERTKLVAAESALRKDPGNKSLIRAVDKQRDALDAAVKFNETDFENKPFFVKPNTNGVETVDYKTIDHPALRKWKWIGTDTAGTPIMMQGNMYIHPEAYSRINALLGKSLIRSFEVPKGIPLVGGTHPGDAMLKAGAFVKGTILLGPFHQFHLGEHAVFHGVNPIDAPEINFDTRPVLREGVEHGLMLYNHNAMFEFSEGLASGGLLHKLPYAGDVLKSYQEWLFQDYIPRLKAAMFEHAVKRAEKYYADDLASGKFTRDQLLDNAAKQGNAAFGELNYKYMGRNPTYQDALRLVLLAPDFLEARFKFAGQALRPRGKEQAMAFVRSALIMGLGAQTINAMFGDDRDKVDAANRWSMRAITNRMHWDKPFSVVMNGREYSPRSVPADMYHLLADPRGFWYNRVNPLWVKPVIELASGKDINGQTESFTDGMKNILKSFTPIPVQGAIRNNQGQTVLQGVVSTLLQSVGVSNFPSKTSAEKLIGNISFGHRTLSGESVREQKKYSDYADLKSDYMDGKLNSMDDVVAKAKANNMIISKAMYRAIQASRDSSPEAKVTLNEHRMAQFSSDELLQVWEKMDDVERPAYKAFMLNKMAHSTTLSGPEKLAAIQHIQGQ